MLVEFNPPKQLRHSENAFILLADGEEDLLLPKKLTELKYVDTPDGQRVEAAEIPEFIATARGLLESEQPTEDVEPSISRHDWFMGIALLGMLIRGSDVNDAVWESGKVADKIVDTP